MASSASNVDPKTIMRDYVRDYQMRHAHFEKVAKIGHDILRGEIELDEKSGKEEIKKIYQYRAKSPESLEIKLKRRNEKWKLEKPGNGIGYTRKEDIDRDVKDFAGVRVVLYFPDQAERVRESSRTHLRS